MTFEDIMDLVFVEDYIPEFIEEAYAIYYDMSSVELTPNDVQQIMESQYSEKFSKISYLSVYFKLKELEDYVNKECDELLKNIPSAD